MLHSMVMLRVLSCLSQCMWFMACANALCGAVSSPVPAPQLAKKVLGSRWTQSLIHHANMDLSGKTVLTVADWKRRAGY